MRRLRSLVCSALLVGWPSLLLTGQASTSGKVASSRTVPLSSLPAAREATLPREANTAEVLVCLYRSMDGSRATDVRRFWSAAAPAWVASVAADSKLHDVVEGVAAACPATLAKADALQDSSDIRLPANQHLIAAAAAPVPAQPKPLPSVAPSTRTQTRNAGDLSAFSAAGLNYEHELTAIYVGDFANARLKNDSPAFSFLLGNYIDTFSRRCADYLPANKVELMESYCETERVPVNRYGGQVGMATCSSYATRGTGRYADPALEAASSRISAQNAAAMLGNLWGSLKDRDANPMAPLSSSLQMTDAAASVGSDMATLLQTNGCGSAATRHFQGNMLAFANGQQGETVSLPAGSALLRASSANTANLSREIDGERLLNDLITEQSRTWMMNRYVSGSATGAHSTRDGAGRVSVLSGSYRYSTLGETTNGTVRVDFTDGLPSCIYFSDNPTTCRAASRRIANAYESGAYAR